MIKYYLFLMILLSSLNYSCYKKFEIDNYTKLNKTQIIELINEKEFQLNYLKKQKYLLENKNNQFLFYIQFQKSYNIDTDYLQNIVEKNRESINKIELNIKKILLELKILKKYI